jgi:hypothetical protein
MGASLSKQKLGIAADRSHATKHMPAHIVGWEQSWRRFMHELHPESLTGESHSSAYET